jgi:hypothetical protein
LEGSPNMHNKQTLFSSEYAVCISSSISLTW